MPRLAPIGLSTKDFKVKSFILSPSSHKKQIKSCIHDMRYSAAILFLFDFSYVHVKHIVSFTVWIRNTCVPKKGPQKLPIVYILLIENLTNITIFDLSS